MIFSMRERTLIRSVHREMSKRGREREEEREGEKEREREREREREALKIGSLSHFKPHLLEVATSILLL